MISPTNAPEKQGRSENFGHNAIIDLLRRFDYNEKFDCLSILFPTTFETCPKACLAMACTCVGVLISYIIFYSQFFRLLTVLMKGSWDIRSRFRLPVIDMSLFIRQ